MTICHGRIVGVGCPKLKMDGGPYLKKFSDRVRLAIKKNCHYAVKTVFEPLGGPFKPLGGPKL
jgi:hypothetical protein